MRFLYSCLSFVRVVMIMIMLHAANDFLVIIAILLDLFAQSVSAGLFFLRYFGSSKMLFSSLLPFFLHFSSFFLFFLFIQLFFCEVCKWLVRKRGFSYKVKICYIWCGLLEGRTSAISIVEARLENVRADTL